MTQFFTTRAGTIKTFRVSKGHDLRTTFGAIYAHGISRQAAAIRIIAELLYLTPLDIDDQSPLQSRKIACLGARPYSIKQKREQELTHPHSRDIID